MSEDPFAFGPDASTREHNTRSRTWGKEKKKVGLLDNSSAKRKKVDLNPFQRRWFDKNGYTFYRVEHANAYGAVTVDLWGFGDYLSCKPGEIWLIQTTTFDNSATRENKARKIPELRKWLESGGRFAVHGWEQPGGKGTEWKNVIREITLADLDQERKRFKRDVHERYEL